MPDLEDLERRIKRVEDKLGIVDKYRYGFADLAENLDHRVHRFISNAKAWIIGTHHGVDAKYLGRYLSEYAYRFNRRHDLDSLFHRALTACALAKPITAQALS